MMNKAIVEAAANLSIGVIVLQKKPNSYTAPIVKRFSKVGSKGLPSNKITKYKNNNHCDGGEGLVGLTRGFMFAGAKRVAISLWSVDDSATATLMQKFY